MDVFSIVAGGLAAGLLVAFAFMTGLAWPTVSVDGQLLATGGVLAGLSLLALAWRAPANP